MGPIDVALNDRFRLPQFRPHQREAIENVLAGRDTLVVMPTGGGKSLCYQLPATLLSGVTLVVSPLISLMKDQVDSLHRIGVPAVAINSTLTFNTARELVRRAQQGKIKMLFVAPERLESSTFREELGGLNVSLLAIDEAHCISEWGHDFRTSYRRLPSVYDAFANRPPVIALTATATPEVRADIRALLNLQSPLEIVTGFERTNIAYGVLREIDKEFRLRDILRSVSEGSSIVYAATRKNVERITIWLKSIGMSAESYHAGMPLALRKLVQERFQSGQTKVIVATSAFGMGIDKPDVRTVIHYDIPGSVEAYYQESGRAGRDGLRSHAILFFSERDVKLQEILIRSSTPSAADVRSVYNALHEIAGTPRGAVYPSILTIDSGLLLKRIVKPTSSLDRIIEVLEEAGHVRNHRGMAREARARIRFTATRARLDEVVFKSGSKPVKTAITALLRTLGQEAFEQEVYFDPAQTIERHNLDTEDFKVAVRTLEGLGLVRYTPPPPKTNGETFHLSLPTERVAIEHLDFGERRMEMRLKANLDKLERMVRYATDWNCRRDTVLQYFGEKADSPRCGRCDVCIARTTSSQPNR
jgi:ATP-dependent DNA helicase RecQ